MNSYLIGGAVLTIVVLGFLLRSAYERTGELEAKLDTQVDQTLECVNANGTNRETINTLRKQVTTMIEERRVDTERREQVLVEREQELLRATARADRLEEERDDEIDTNPDCADLTSLSLDMFCPNTAQLLRQRSIGVSGDSN